MMSGKPVDSKTVLLEIPGGKEDYWCHLANEVVRLNGRVAESWSTNIPLRNDIVVCLCIDL